MICEQVYKIISYHLLPELLLLLKLNPITYLEMDKKVKYQHLKIIKRSLHMQHLSLIMGFSFSYRLSLLLQTL